MLFVYLLLGGVFTFGRRVAQVTLENLWSIKKASLAATSNFTKGG